MLFFSMFFKIHFKKLGLAVTENLKLQWFLKGKDLLLLHIKDSCVALIQKFLRDPGFLVLCHPHDVVTLMVKVVAFLFQAVG